MAIRGPLQHPISTKLYASGGALRPSAARARGVAGNARRWSRSASLRVDNVLEFPRSTVGAGEEALLCAKFTAHSAALAGVLVLEDEDDSKQVITASLDKTVALWTSEGTCSAFGDAGSGYTEARRLTPLGGPVFSLLLDRRSDDGLPSQVYLGNHAKQVLAWVPPREALEAGVVLDAQCGWVRALAAAGSRWLFSAACNQLHVWDMARAVPSLVSTVSLERGDILALAATRTGVYTAGADGALRAFSVGKAGELTEVAARPRAHNDRVTALALAGNLLISSSYDGSLKAWDPASLEIVVGAQAAHAGERVHCLALGPDGLLYSGGDDHLVRRWSPGLLTQAAGPLYGHSHCVRALAAGPRELVVSGDKSGEVAVWKVV